MTSVQLFDRAKRVIPGGVNSPVRAFNAVGGDPVYVVRGSGCRMTTADGQELVDFCGSWGPLLFGRARSEIVEAIRQAAGEGTSFGINTPREVEFAEGLCRRVPSVEMVRLVSSGTEAVMTALRLARGPLPWHVGTRHLPAPIPVRSRLCLRRPYRDRNPGIPRCRRKRDGKARRRAELTRSG